MKLEYQNRFQENKLRLCGLLAVALVFAGGSVSAWAQVTASVVGTVQDVSGAVIPGVSVTVKDLETGVARTVTTDERGYYRALSLPVGRYEVAAEKSGFKRQVRTGINLVVGQEAVVNLSLEVGEVQQAVTVTAEAPIVNTTTASTAGLVGEREVKDLPLNGRSFDNLITLNPGTTNIATAMKDNSGANPPGAMFNINGRRSNDNMFLLNGIEYTGSALSGNTPGGASGQLLGIDAVREFNVQANTYGAEYGKRAGGQISIVTMSGTNQLHGTAFEFLRNSVLDARNFFDVTKPQFRRNDFGGSAGGPIRKDKTFVFGNYEAYRQSLTITSVAFVPDANARQGLLPTGPGGSPLNVGLAPGMAPYFAIYPQPNGPELGGGIAEAISPANNPVREDFGTVRMDQVFSVKDMLSGSYTVDDGAVTTPNLDPFSGTILDLRAQVLSLEETHTFSPSLINIARVGFSRAANFSDNHPLISLPPSLSIIAGRPLGVITIGGGATVVGAGAISAFGSSNVQRQEKRNYFTYSDSVQIVKGKHQISLGAWFERLRLDDLNGTSYGYGGLQFSDLTSFIQGKVALLQAGLSWVRLGHRNWMGAGYAQDTIKVSSNFTLNLGLRDEFTNGWNVHPARPIINYTIGTNGGIDQPISGSSLFTKNNATHLFAPRVGLAWDPFGKGKTSIHAGFGTYYNLYDDLAFIIPQLSGIQLSNVQFPIQLQPGATIAGAVPAPRDLTPSDAKTPTVLEWSFSIEQQLTPGTAISLGYVGSHGYHFLESGDMNPTQSVICSAALGNCPAGLADGTKFYPPGTKPLNPALGSATSWVSAVGTSYQALQVDLRQRFSKGLTFRADYTFSKALDDGSTIGSSFFTNCQSYILDVFDVRRDYGPSCYGITQRFVFNGSYDLPLGQGKALFRGATGAADKLLSGWRLIGIVSAQNGVPFTPTVGFNVSRNGAHTIPDRPSVNPNFSGPANVGTPNEWFNPSAFILPPAGTYGNVGRNTLRGPGLTDLDLSVLKDTRMTERLNLEFRAEFFNLLNHANFGIPARSLFTTSGAPVSSAGVITNTVTTSRQIQFGLKLIF